MAKHQNSGAHQLTTKGLCDELVQRYTQRPDHRYCFLLGAGASFTSGIPSGESLAKIWLGELHKRSCLNGTELAAWGKERFGAEFDSERPGDRYGDIYEARFAGDRNDGYAHLETIMERKEPSIGYSYLGYLLSETRHNVAITTNFDNLVADSVSIYGRKFPIVLADDSLAYYAATELRRPLVAKIHGGLGFTPKNSVHETRKLPSQWASALTNIFNKYEPIVAGYAGNDGSLMDLLQCLDGTVLYWCLRTSPANLTNAIAQLPERVKKLTEQHAVYFVPIDSFDHLMVAIWTALAKKDPERFPDLLEGLNKRHAERVASHEKQRAEQTVSGPGGATAPELVPPSLRSLIAEEGSRRKDKPWWLYQQEIAALTDNDEKDRGYCDAIAALPNSVPLLNNYAYFLTSVRERHDEAETYFQRALQADPKDATVLGNYAYFLTSVRQRHDEAETFCQRALEADPKHAINLSNYANLLRSVGQHHDEAETYYQRALQVDPMHASILGNYAYFLTSVRQRDDEAATYYLRALQTDPKHPNNLGNYAQLLLVTGRAVEGLARLVAAEQSDHLVPGVAAELAFYRYAHDATQRPQALGRLKALVLSGARSLGWDLSRNIEQAERDGHPNVHLLKALDAVITGGGRPGDVGRIS